MREGYAIYARVIYPVRTRKILIGEGCIVIAIRHNVYCMTLSFVDYQGFMKT